MSYADFHLVFIVTAFFSQPNQLIHQVLHQ